MSERWACQVLSQPRSTQQRQRHVPSDEPRLLKRIVELKSEDALERLSDLFVRRGVPTYIHSDNGSEFTATKVREWLARVGVKTLFIDPGSPWENGYIESFNGKLRDELLAREQFDALLEAKVLIERWRKHFNAVRPHSSLGYRAPAPEEAIQPASLASAPPSEPEQKLKGVAAKLKFGGAFNALGRNHPQKSE